MTEFKVGIDSYCLSPLRLEPFAVLEWVARHNGDGVQFSEVHWPTGWVDDTTALQDLAAAASERGLYLEWGGGQHVPFDTTTWADKNLLADNSQAAKQAHALGARIVRSCSGGFFRWHDAAPDTEELLRATATALRAEAPLFEELGVTLAIELHFEFTTFELLRLFEMCNATPGGWLGVCLDTFNVLPLLEDPVAATKRILPWVVATHVKDGGLVLDDTGIVSFPTRVGRGSVDLRAIIELLGTLDRPVNLSVEDHGGSFTTNIHDEVFMARFPDVTRAELDGLVATARAGRTLLASGDLAVTERKAWPEVCEERTRAGLRHLRGLVEEMPA